MRTSFATISPSRGVWALCLLLATVVFPAHALDNRVIDYPSFVGKVIDVTSGSELRLLLASGEELQVRLAAIQAPSVGEYHAMESFSWLRLQLQNQIVSADCVSELTPDGFYKCVVYPDDRNINKLGLRYGVMRSNEADLSRPELAKLLDPRQFQMAMEIARTSRLGLWATLPDT